MSFAVITEVPDPKADDGNMACPLGDVYFVIGSDPDTHAARLEPVALEVQFGLRTPVFSLGEILVLDESGREIGGAMRKPTKWFVGVELFDDLAGAIARSREVTAL